MELNIKEEKTPVIYGFVKLFEKEKFAQDFIEGRMYMNTVKHFRDSKDADGRGDKYEGFSFYMPPSQEYDVTVNNNVVAHCGASAIGHSNSLLKRNIFCLFALNSSGYEELSKENIADFKKSVMTSKEYYSLGDYVVFVKCAQTFMDRFVNNLGKIGQWYKKGLVEYFDEEKIKVVTEKELGFVKPECLAYQREFRFMADTCNDEAIIVDIGDINDIADMYTLEEFKKNAFKLSLPDGSKA